MIVNEVPSIVVIVFTYILNGIVCGDFARCFILCLAVTCGSLAWNSGITDTIREFRAQWRHLRISDVAFQFSRRK